MRLLDRLFDTYYKRLFAVAVCIIGIFVYFRVNDYLLGAFLIKLERVDDVFGLVDYPVVARTFLGRLTIAYLDNGNDAIRALITAGGVIRTISCLFGIIFVAEHYRWAELNRIRSAIGVMFALLLIEYVWIGMLGVRVLTTDSTTYAIAALNNIGTVLRYGSIILIVAGLSALTYLVMHLKNDEQTK